MRFVRNPPEVSNSNYSYQIVYQTNRRNVLLYLRTREREKKPTSNKKPTLWMHFSPWYSRKIHYPFDTSRTSWMLHRHYIHSIKFSFQIDPSSAYPAFNDLRLLVLSLSPFTKLTQTRAFFFHFITLYALSGFWSTATSSWGFSFNVFIRLMLRYRHLYEQCVFSLYNFYIFPRWGFPSFSIGWVFFLVRAFFFCRFFYLYHGESITCIV